MNDANTFPDSPIPGDAAPLVLNQSKFALFKGLNCQGTVSQVQGIIRDRISIIHLSLCTYEEKSSEMVILRQYKNAKLREQWIKVLKKAKSELNGGSIVKIKRGVPNLKIVHESRTPQDYKYI